MKKEYIDIGYLYTAFTHQDECCRVKYELEVDEDSCVLHYEAETTTALEHTHFHDYSLTPELAFEVCGMIDRGEIIQAFKKAMDEGTVMYQKDWEYGAVINEYPKE